MRVFFGLLRKNSKYAQEKFTEEGMNYLKKPPDIWGDNLEE